MKHFGLDQQPNATSLVVATNRTSLPKSLPRNSERRYVRNVWLPRQRSTRRIRFAVTLRPGFVEPSLEFSHQTPSPRQDTPWPMHKFTIAHSAAKQVLNWSSFGVRNLGSGRGQQTGPSRWRNPTHLI
jgi:hypothetical protein